MLGHHKVQGKVGNSLENTNFFPFVSLSPVLSLFGVPQIHPESSRAPHHHSPISCLKNGEFTLKTTGKWALHSPSIHQQLPEGSGIGGAPVGVQGILSA